ncbi:MAG TPA: hypothetical protein PLV70_08585, partial [Flavobacteriales bacterium]|nr:hypothetical protein [Flavobacteriales bacterium]
MTLFLLTALGLIVLAYFGLCLFYWIFQERFIFVRFTLPERYRFRFTQPCEELWLDRPDGARLHALHFPVKDALGAVLYLHGNTGSAKTQILARLAARGHQVVDLEGLANH